MIPPSNEEAAGEEWAVRVRKASAMMLDLLPMLVAADDDPTVAAIAGMLLARAVCCAVPGMPAFSDIAVLVAELPDPIDLPELEEEVEEEEGEGGG